MPCYQIVVFGGLFYNTTMKLLLCLDCSDIFLLIKEERKCKCGKTKGKYVDDLNAEISGNCTPIGFANESFIKALKMQIFENNIQHTGDVCCKGVEFNAFIIPDWAKSIKRV